MRFKPGGGMSAKDRLERKARLRALKSQEDELRKAKEEELAAKREAEKEKRWARYAEAKKAENFSMLTKLRNKRKKKLSNKHYGKVRMVRDGVMNL